MGSGSRMTFRFHQFDGGSNPYFLTPYGTAKNVTREKLWRDEKFVSSDPLSIHENYRVFFSFDISINLNNPMGIQFLIDILQAL